MTQAEGDELAAKLTRIWFSKGEFRQGIEVSTEGGVFLFKTRISEDDQFSCLDNATAINARTRRVFRLLRIRDSQFIGLLSCLAQSGEIDSRNWGTSVESDALYQQFDAERMPFFRRGCWLSGCPIECSAHERMEWTVWLQTRQ